MRGPSPALFEVAPGVHRIPLPLPNDGLRAVSVYALVHGADLLLTPSPAPPPSPAPQPVPPPRPAPAARRHPPGARPTGRLRPPRRRRRRTRARISPSGSPKRRSGGRAPARTFSPRPAVPGHPLHKDDILAGNDDPNLPLVTCSTDHKRAYLLAPSIISGDQIQNATSGMNQRGIGYVVDLQFKGPAANTWADFTAAHIGTQTAFTLDSQVVSAPMIQEASPAAGPRSAVVTRRSPLDRAPAGQRPEVRVAAAVLRIVGSPNSFGDIGIDVAASGPDRRCDRVAAGAGVFVAVLPGAGLLTALSLTLPAQWFSRSWCSWADISTTPWTWRVSRV